ncbi:MAG TPA: NAD(P)/FAD-dependent oxidoreductase [Gemmatimonadaceae bacterium]|nr:NAD(P)/FAD-dependent oxidoreductase [Gemmatimonadaceae bacterium]
MKSRLSRRTALDVLIVGAGQAGLALGRELERAGVDFLLLDAARAVGDSWRARWDSLRLFTPAEHSSLPGLPFPARRGHFPTKDEVADYLQAYAAAFNLPIGLDESVRSLRQIREFDFLIETDFARYRARQVVIASGAFHGAYVPPLAATVAPQVRQLHASSYRNPRELPEGRVLVVGGGNSGVQIAEELTQTHDVIFAVGTRPPRLPARVLGKSIFWWLDRSGALGVPADSRMGRQARKVEFLIGRGFGHAARSGARIVPRIVGVRDGMPCDADGERHDVASIVWATGFRPTYPWVDLPVFDRNGAPRHRRGVTAVPGAYFLGLPWLHSRGSALLGWVAKDAAYLAQHIISALPARNFGRSNVGSRVAS